MQNKGLQIIIGARKIQKRQIGKDKSSSLNHMVQT